MAFSTPQDGAGLAAIYGGRDGLAKKLDEFFSTPEDALHTGGYGGTIHEMLEARDVRMGQYGHSNQPSHHITYMYDFAGQPWKTQAMVREALSRLYLGSEIGQGYPGDEDNGEMSAWYLFSSLGFYPLQVGSPTYAIGVAAVHQGDGPAGRRQEAGDQRTEQQREERLREERSRQRQELDLDRVAARPDRERRQDRVRDDRPAVELGHRPQRRAAVDHHPGRGPEDLAGLDRRHRRRDRRRRCGRVRADRQRLQDPGHADRRDPDGDGRAAAGPAGRRCTR